MNRYQLWDGVSTIYTPGIDPAHGSSVYTPEEWQAKYPWYNNGANAMVISADIINGGFCAPLAQMVSLYGSQGADFSAATSDLDKLAVIEAWEEQMNSEAASTPSAEERIAAAMEYQALSSLPDATN